jgi:uncharacterized protein
MKKLFKKESEVEKNSKKHVETVYECVNKLKELMDCFYRNDFEALNKKVAEISKLEHSADEIRRHMEMEYYEGAFLPFDREDRIVLAEEVDGVADMTEEAAYGICLSKVQFPENFKHDFLELTESVCDTVNALKKCIESLDVDLGDAIKKAHEIEKKEDYSDKIERNVIKKLYGSYRNQEFGILSLIELKSIVRRLGKIVDRAENASDRVLIMVAKRRG